MNVKILVIEQKIGIAVSVKQALEGTGHYEVFPFADAALALEFLQDNAPQVVIVNMHMPNFGGGDLVRSVKATAPQAIVVASTSDSAMASRAVSAGAQGLLQERYLARDVMETLDQIAPHLAPDEETNTGSRRMTRVQPTQDVPPTATNQFEPVRPPSVQGGDTSELDSVFDKLREEEPPIPGFKEGGTITTYMQQVSAAELNDLLSSLNDVVEPLPAGEVPTDEQETESDTPAQFILEHAAGEDIPLDDVPFEMYLERIRGKQPPDFSSEPDFLQGRAFERGGDTAPQMLPDESDPVEEDTAADWDPFNQTTQPSAAEQMRIQQDADNPETSTLPGEPLADVDRSPTQPYQQMPQPEEMALPTDAQEARAVPRWDWGDEDIDTPAPTSSEDPRIVQMAVSLTQASLESTAEATLLTKDGELLADDGVLADEDIEEVLAAFKNDKHPIPENAGRVQFIRLSSNGLDYMIYSCYTDADHILSMVFEGNTGLTNIRQQAERIAGALATVPQLSPEDLMLGQNEPDVSAAGADEVPSKGGLRLAAPAHIEPGVLTEYTFLWLPRGEITLPYEMREAIDSGLRVQMVERGWQINLVEVQEDYVVMVAGVPGDEPPQSVVRNLQKRAAKIAQQQNPAVNPDTLWAESYFILTPGRPLNVQEIQQYMNFYRM